MLLAGLNQAQVEKERLQSRYYPSARLEAGYFNQIQNERQSLSASDKQAFEDRFGEGWQAQLKLEFPLFLGGARSKQVDQANVHILELESSINSVKNVLSERSRAGLSIEKYQFRYVAGLRMSQVGSSGFSRNRG